MVRPDRRDYLALKVEKSAIDTMDKSDYKVYFEKCLINIKGK